jgi:DnaJ-class molecular chaperone
LTKKRKNSGGSFFGALFGARKTVKHKTNWVGQRVTVVKYRDSGKTKSYTQGAGLFGPKIRTETRNRNGRLVERGYLRTSTLTGKTSEHSKRVDGSGRSITRQHDRGMFRNKTITKVHDGCGRQVASGITTQGVITGIVSSRYSGICFGCEGKGTREFDCRACVSTGRYSGICKSCNGTGSFWPKEQQCGSCAGTGKFKARSCKRCRGTGCLKPSPCTCNRCCGKGEFVDRCRACNGYGKISVTCKKCSGSGRYSKIR